MEPPDRTDIRVLHVDDDPAFTDLVESFLEREDGRLTVETAESVAEAEDRLGEETFDCVVSDYEMPARSGVEFLESVRETYPELPFILFTGKGSEEVASEAISAGVTDYLQKETGTDQYELLANRIDNAVGGLRSRELLSERTRQLSTLISNLPGVVYRCRNEPGWPMEAVEGEVESTVGYTAAELERNEIDWSKDIVHPADREGLWDAVQEGVSTDGSFEVTYRAVAADGTTKWLWERGRLVEHEGNDAEILEGFITDITERKEREEELERTTARLEALFENSPDMINVHDAEGNILDPNARLCEETGYSEAELTGMSVWDLDTTAEPEEVREVWRSMDLGDRNRLRGRYRRRDGSTFPVEVHLRQLDLDGEDHFVVISRDVTEREERERELRRYERMTNTMPSAACIYDEDGRFEVVNQYLADFYGTTPEALVGEQSNLIPKVRERHDGDPYEELLAGERSELQGEVEGDFPNANQRVLSYRLTPFEVDGDVVGTVGVAHDVTERVEHERELEETNALLSTLFETVPFGVLVEDASRNVVTANQQLLDLFGLSGDTEAVVGEDCEAFSEDISDLFADSEKFVERTSTVVSTSEPIESEELALRDGRTFVRSHEPIQLPNRDGHLWTYRDVTEQKDREAELERQNERLDEFASVVSHDLRNPLNVAMGNLALAMDEHESDSLAAIERAHERMETLIDEMLVLARGNEEVETVESVALGGLAEGCWANVPTDDATLRIEGERTVRANRSRLEQVFENLYRNAVEHGATNSRPSTGDAVEHGGEDVTVTVGTLDDGFYVADDGPGIPAEEREAVFESGYSNAEDGAGFGLPIVEQVATAHGWTLDLTESADGGARFEFRNVAFDDGGDGSAN